MKRAGEEAQDDGAPKRLRPLYNPNAAPPQPAQAPGAWGGGVPAPAAQPGVQQGYAQPYNQPPFIPGYHGPPGAQGYSQAFPQPGAPPQPYGQAPTQQPPYGQPYAQPVSQGYGPPSSQGYAQPGAQGYAQPGAQQYGQSYGQPNAPPFPQQPSAQPFAPPYGTPAMGGPPPQYGVPPIPGSAHTPYAAPNPASPPLGPAAAPPFRPNLSPSPSGLVPLGGGPVPPGNSAVGPVAPGNPVLSPHRPPVPSPHFASGNAHVQSRAVVVSGLPPGVTYRELFNALRYGVIESVRLIPEDCTAMVHFVDWESARTLLWEADDMLMLVRGEAIAVKAASPPLPNPRIQKMIRMGASRCLTIRGLDNGITEEELSRDFSSYGIVESVQIVHPDPNSSMSGSLGYLNIPGNFANVHFTSIEAANHAKEQAIADPQWANSDIEFGADRCRVENKPSFEGSADPEIPNYVRSRSVWLGNLHPHVTREELLELVHHGAVENLDLRRDKASASVHFVNVESAGAFIRMAKGKKVVCKDRELRVAWGRTYTPPPPIQRAIQDGATRCVYFGNFSPPRSTEWLKEQMQPFGTVVSIRNFAARGIAFVSFSSIHSALNCVEMMRVRTQEDPDWRRVKLNFAKDPCASIKSMGNSDRKPPVCQFFLKGHCKNGSQCPYRHPTASNRNEQLLPAQPFPDLEQYKVKLCRSWVENASCKDGDRCSFAHGTHELRD